MPLIDKCVVSLTGFKGAPGSAVFYARPAGNVATHLRTFWAALAPWLPNGMTVAVPGTGDSLDEATSVVMDTWVVTPAPTTIVASGSTSYAGPAGACATWLTTDLNPRGHRYRGRTFIVPLNTSAYDTDGTIHPTALNAIRVAADQLVVNGAAHFAVYHRAVSGGGGGSSHLITSAKVADRVAYLRSRA